LTLEITETAPMADADKALAVLTGLRELGVHIAVDDSGTGYSSLELPETAAGRQAEDRPVVRRRRRRRLRRPRDRSSSRWWPKASRTTRSGTG
jgi:hypothetical protein